MMNKTCDMQLVFLLLLDLPVLFLYSPSENMMDRDTYTVEEGRSFELICSNGLYNLDDTFMLEHNGKLVNTSM